MRALKVTIISAAAVLTLATAPAFAGPHWHGHSHGYWGGPGLVFGLAGAALLAGVAAETCVRYEPIFDAYGNYMGRRPVNMC